MKKGGLGIGLIILLGLPLLVLLVVQYFKRSKTVNPPTKTSILNKDVSDLYFSLIENGFNYKTARFIAAQSGHETGDFKSKIFLENHNYFGMKLALVRKTTALGERYGHAYYIDNESSVKDFRLYWQSFKYPETFKDLQSYVHSLKQNAYFEADENAYLLGCINFYNKYWGSA